MNFDVHHLQQWVRALGFWGSHIAIWVTVFAESGLFIGFFLPGDSLLFTAGFLASPKVALLNISLLVIGSFVCAVLGDSVGYSTGHRFGRRLFQRKDSRWFHHKHLVSAQKFYDKHGKKTIVLARFLPIVRTFTPIIAGIAGMNYRIFLTYNVLGGLVWTFGLASLGYVLGNIIPDVDKYLLPIIVLIICVSFIPPALHWYQARKQPH